MILYDKECYFIMLEQSCWYRACAHSLSLELNIPTQILSFKLTFQQLSTNMYL